MGGVGSTGLGMKASPFMGGIIVVFLSPSGGMRNCMSKAAVSCRVSKVSDRKKFLLRPGPGDTEENTQTIGQH